ncbi:hypothetical protein LWM68_27150 [Niabella sp. W65]|nr:hypothetical protein [Niabella sp. W65]MCH7366122.1 hypothetical protein [Niabella sp. W65]
MQLKPLLTSLLSTALLCASAQTPLSPGDIAFTGLNSTNNTVNDFVNTPQSEVNREFSFVLLKAVTAGTTIFFTDFGWRTDAQAFQTANACGASTGAVSDGVVRWQADGPLAYGTQIVIRSVSSPKANVGSATGTQATYNSSVTPPLQYITLASPGETVFAFTGTLAAPTLLGAICANPGGWAATLNNCDFQPTASSLPNVLNNALNGNRNYAFAVLPPSGSGYCMRLKPTVTIGADAAAARATIYTAANWESNGSASAYTLTTNSSVLPVTYGKISAVVSNNRLSVNWETVAETNCKQYNVEASVDGIRWIPIATVSSKAPGGILPASFHITSISTFRVFLFAFGGLIALLLALPHKRKYTWLAVVSLSIVFIACNKNNNGTGVDSNTRFFIRIGQQDIDGHTSYSKVFEAVTK